MAGEDITVQRVLDSIFVQQPPEANVTVEQSQQEIKLVAPSGPTQVLPVSTVARVGIVLTGTIDGVNTVFTFPEEFVRVIGGETARIFYNGQRLEEGAGNDYTLSESGGAGTGFDTATTTFAPLSGDKLTADYTKA